MDKIWDEMYAAAKAVLNERRISDYVTCGEVAAAVLSASGKIYTGVCIDTCSTLGICAERNAIFNMITCGESQISKVLKTRSHACSVFCPTAQTARRAAHAAS